MWTLVTGTNLRAATSLGRISSIKLSPCGAHSEDSRTWTWTSPSFPTPLLVSCRWSRIVRKRITRIPSDTQVYEQEVLENKKSPNDCLPLNLVNRNPRNLEQLSFEPKPLGWELDRPSKTFWNKVIFEKTGKYVEARVVHYSGRTLVSASTRESAFKGQISSTSDAEAASNVGKVLAKRCLESGIIAVHKEVSHQEAKSKKVDAFIKALREGGLQLKEAEYIFPRRIRDL